jgi:hypothetical protein
LIRASAANGALTSRSDRYNVRAIGSADLTISLRAL